MGKPKPGGWLHPSSQTPGAKRLQGGTFSSPRTGFLRQRRLSGPLRPLETVASFSHLSKAPKTCPARSPLAEAERASTRSTGDIL